MKQSIKDIALTVYFIIRDNVLSGFLWVFWLSLFLPVMGYFFLESDNYSFPYFENYIVFYILGSLAIVLGISFWSLYQVYSFKFISCPAERSLGVPDEMAVMFNLSQEKISVLQKAAIVEIDFRGDSVKSLGSFDFALMIQKEIQKREESSYN